MFVLFEHLLLPSVGLASGNRPNNEKWFFAARDRFRQWSVWRLVRQVFFAGEKTQKCPTLLRAMITDGPLKHRITRFERIEHGTCGDRRLDFELYLDADMSERAQVLWEQNANHVISETTEQVCDYFSRYF
jgi:hypothetical protein